MAKSYSRIEAVMRMASIMDVIAEAREPVSGAAVAERTGIPYGSAMGYLATLEDVGYVTRVGDAWKLGMKLALMWARKKSTLEAEKNRIEHDIRSIGVEQ